ncbi:MAG: hypothetical protein J6A75_08325 [Lachnospiraceae bacterium]|nr:hypothetical protein [Lachnospiraceae bacterium]
MKKETGLDYIWLALYAFGGIGLEVILAFGLEPALYGAQMSDWLLWQHILHWILTCIVWGTVGVVLIKYAKKSYQFDILQKGEKMKSWQWGFVVFFVVLSLFISYLDWNGSKLIIEFYANGWLKFIFQYIYYVFETFLVMLILIFGQRAFELWFHKPNIPYGGIVLALTWGIAHFFTKDIMTGILCMISGFAFGSVYLLVNRDVRKGFWILFVMFVL